MAKQTKVQFPVTSGNPVIPKPMSDSTDIPSTGLHQHSMPKLSTGATPLTPSNRKPILPVKVPKP